MRVGNGPQEVAQCQRVSMRVVVFLRVYEARAELCSFGVPIDIFQFSPGVLRLEFVKHLVKSLTVGELGEIIQRRTCGLVKVDRWILRAVDAERVCIQVDNRPARRDVHDRVVVGK